MTTTPRGPLNSTVPPESQVVGGVYNVTPPAPQDEQPCALQLDSEGNLLVNVAVGGGGCSGTVKIEDTSGNVLNSNGSGALNVAVVSGGGSNASVGVTGAAAPASATEIGIINGSGNLTGVSPTTPLPISATAAANASGNPIFTESVSGSTTAVTQATGSNLHAVLDSGTLTSITNPITVVGDAASGAAVAGNPVLVAGQDGTDARTLLTSNTGQLHVLTDSGSTVAVSAVSGVVEVGPTGSANTKTNPFFNAITDGTNVITAAISAWGTAPTGTEVMGVNVSGTTTDGTTTETNFLVIGGESNDATAQYQPIPLGPAGRSVLIEGVSGSVAIPSNITQVTGSTISKTNPLFTEISDGTNTMGAMAVFGTSPTAVDALNVNAGIFATYNIAPIANPSAGAFVPMQSDLNGNLKTMPGLTTQTLTVWTSSNFTGGFTVVLAENTGANAVLIQLDQNSGTFTTGAVTWQGTYDGTNWVTIPAQQVLDPTSVSFATIGNPYTFVASTNKSFLILMGGYQQIRALESTALTTTGTVTPYVTQLAYAPVSYQKVQGMTSSGSVISGNPVLIGGTDGTDLRSLLTDNLGSLIPASTGIAFGDGFGNTQQVWLSGQAGGSTPVVIPYNFIFNGTTWDRLRSGSTTGSLLVNNGTAANFLAKVDIVGNAGATLDQANGSAVPTNGLMIGGGSIAGGTNFTTLTVKAASTAAAATDTSLVVQPLVNSHTMVTAASGVQQVGIVGNAAAVMDAVTTAATTPANGLATLVSNVTTPPSLTTGQSVATQCDYQGSQFVKPYRRGQTASKATTIASSAAATTVLAAQASGIFADISNLVITVTPAATADLAFTATLSDGTNSYIYDMDTGALATATADPTIININFNPPLPASSAATAWTIQLSVATVTVHITVVAVLQKAS